MGTWTLGADNATVRNVPEPGSGPIQPRRPIPALSRINAIRFDGKSIYHGATIKLERRLRNHYAYNVSYTLSRSKDDASSPGATESEANVPQNVRNVFDDTGEWARSSFDNRHLFVASGTWLLPRDWRVGAIFAARSGAPFIVNLGVDRANIGAGPAQRPDALGDPNLPGGERTPDRWFDTGAFALPAAFGFGTARRNSVVGPGLCEPGPVTGQGPWSRGRAPTGGAARRVQRPQPRQLRPAEPNLRHAELRPDLQREKRARDATWRTAEPVSAEMGPADPCGIVRARSRPRKRLTGAHRRCGDEHRHAWSC
jgi:hypothetical protein